MNLLLPPELQVFLAEQLQSGKYKSEAEVYITPLQSFADREKYLQAKRDELREAVRIGTEQADRGETIDGETAMAGFRQKLEQWREQSELSTAKVVEEFNQNQFSGYNSTRLKGPGQLNGDRMQLVMAI